MIPRPLRSCPQCEMSDRLTVRSTLGDSFHVSCGRCELDGPTVHPPETGRLYWNGPDAAKLAWYRFVGELLEKARR